MSYKVNKENSNVSTTWSIEKLYETALTVENLVDTLKVVDALKKKYPKDDTIAAFDEVVREELCNMFGGTLNDEEK